MRTFDNKKLTYPDGDIYKAIEIISKLNQDVIHVYHLLTMLETDQSEEIVRSCILRSQDFLRKYSVKEPEMITVCAECDGNHSLAGVSWGKSNGGWDGVNICPECGAVEGETKEITVEECINS